MTKLSDLQLARSEKIHYQKGNPTHSIRGGNLPFVLADLLCTHNLVGMSRKEIGEVLGPQNSNRLNQFLHLEKNSDLYCFGQMYLELNYGDDDRVTRLRTIKLVSACKWPPARIDSKWTSARISE